MIRLNKQLYLQKGDSYILFAMLIFGTYSLFLRFFPQIPTLTFLFFFQLVGTLAFLLLQLKSGFPKVRKLSILFLATLSLVALGNDLSYFLALRLTTVSNATLGHQMVSIFLLVLAKAFLNEKTQLREYIALLFSLIGIAIIYYHGLSINHAGDILGISLSLLSAIFYAFLIIHYRYLSRKLSITTINFFRFVFSTILLFPFFLLFKDFNFSFSHLPALITFGFLFAVIASGIHNFGMSKTRALHVSIIGKSEPAIATFYAYLFLHEIPSLETIIGGILIIGSSLFLALSENPSKM